MQAPVQAPVPPPPPPSGEDRRRAALAAAERARWRRTRDDDDDDPIVRKLVEICGVNGYNALKKGNVQTPRDLAAWRGAGDVLRDMLIEEGVAADACPGAAALGAWADAASKALTEDPALGAHVTASRRVRVLCFKTSYPPTVALALGARVAPVRALARLAAVARPVPVRRSRPQYHRREEKAATSSRAVSASVFCAAIARWFEPRDG